MGFWPQVLERWLHVEGKQSQVAISSLVTSYFAKESLTQALACVVRRNSGDEVDRLAVMTWSKLDESRRKATRTNVFHHPDIVASLDEPCACSPLPETATQATSGIGHASRFSESENRDEQDGKRDGNIRVRRTLEPTHVFLFPGPSLSST